MTCNEQKSEARVALIGVSQKSMLLGRACCLSEIPVVGVYDTDPQLALRASLFLGISAHATLEQLWETQPSVLLCSGTLPTELLSTGHQIIALTGDRPDVCTLHFAQDLEDELPSQITSALPTLSLTLSGPSLGVITSLIILAVR